MTTTRRRSGGDAGGGLIALVYTVHRGGRLVARCRELADAVTIVGRGGPDNGGLVHWHGRIVWKEGFENSGLSARINPLEVREVISGRLRGAREKKGPHERQR